METIGYKKSMTETKLSAGEKVKQRQGIAQTMGYVNRREYRKSIYADNRKTRNTSQKQVPTFMIMAGARMSGIPCPPQRPRKKLKGWQKRTGRRK